MSDELPPEIEAILAKPDGERQAHDWETIARYAVERLTEWGERAEELGAVNRQLAGQLQQATKQRDALRAVLTAIISQQRELAALEAELAKRRRRGKTRAAPGRSRPVGRPKHWTAERLLMLMATYEAERNARMKVRGDLREPYINTMRALIRKELGGLTAVDGVSAAKWIERTAKQLMALLNKAKLIADKVRALPHVTLHPVGKLRRALATPTSVLALLSSDDTAPPTKQSPRNTRR
jgi:hypothetical protein